MNPAPTDNPNRQDPLNAYLDGARDAVDAVRPDEPSPEQWDAVLRSVRSRLSVAPTPPARESRRWRLAAVAAGGVTLAAVAAAVAWVALAPVVVKTDRVDSRPAQTVPESLEAKADPLAAFDVLPMASAEEVDLHRLPGAGWLPVGSDPFPAELVLATNKDVELDDPHPTWPQVTPSPGDAPMIFAAKPR